MNAAASIKDASTKKKFIDEFLESNAKLEECLVAQKRFLPSRGAIIAITSETEDGIAGYFCGTVMLRKAPEPMQENSDAISPQLVPTSANFLGNSFPFIKEKFFKENVVRGHFFSEPQRWCIR
jgi:hypothetical protein